MQWGDWEAAQRVSLPLAVVCALKTKHTRCKPNYARATRVYELKQLGLSCTMICAKLKSEGYGEAMVKIDHAAIVFAGQDTPPLPKTNKKTIILV